ncbi:MAG: hypothetical protein ABJC19_11370 [Gemmatimonadota bacterium]
MRDTSRSAATSQDNAIRALAPADRLAQAMALSETNRRLLIAGLRVRHPALTDLQLVELSLGRRLVPLDTTSPPS